MKDTHQIKIRYNPTDSSVVFSTCLTKEAEQVLEVFARVLCEATDWDFNLVITRNLREVGGHDGMHRGTTSRKG